MSDPRASDLMISWSLYAPNMRSIPELTRFVVGFAGHARALPSGGTRDVIMGYYRAAASGLIQNSQHPETEYQCGVYDAAMERDPADASPDYLRGHKAASI